MPFLRILKNVKNQKTSNFDQLSDQFFIQNFKVVQLNKLLNFVKSSKQKLCSPTHPPVNSFFLKKILVLFMAIFQQYWKSITNNNSVSIGSNRNVIKLQFQPNWPSLFTNGETTNDTFQKFIIFSISGYDKIILLIIFFFGGIVLDLVINPAAPGHGSISGRSKAVPPKLKKFAFDRQVIQWLSAEGSIYEN